MSDNFERPTKLEELTLRKVDELRARRDAEAMVAAEDAVAVPARVGSRKVTDVLRQALAELEVRREYGIVGFSTGIPSLDKHLRRALQPGRIICCAAYTKQSKTAFLAQLTVAFAAQGLPLNIGCFEDEQTDLTLRMLANMSSGDIGLIRDAFTLPDGTKLPIPPGFDAAVDKLAALGFDMMTQTGAVEQLAVEMAVWSDEKKAEGHAFGVVIIDQLSQLIPSDQAAFAARFPGYPPPPRQDDLTKMLEWQTKMLRMVARKQNLLVILAHQLNDSAKEWVAPSERSLRNSKGIGHEVDALIIPWRPAKLANPGRGLGEPEWVENTEGRSWFIGPLGRQIQPFKVEVTWHGQQQRFSDLGVAARAPWSAPAAPTEHTLEGMAKLSALKSRWSQDTDRVFDEANGVIEAAATPAVEAGPLPKFATSPDAEWPAEEQPAPAKPAARAGFGGGGKSVTKPSLF